MSARVNAELVGLRDRARSNIEFLTKQIGEGVTKLRFLELEQAQRQAEIDENEATIARCDELLSSEDATRPTGDKA